MGWVPSIYLGVSLKRARIGSWTVKDARVGNFPGEIKWRGGMQLEAVEARVVAGYKNEGVPGAI